MTLTAHTCPWWAGHLLASPIRRLVQEPRRIVGGYVRPGARVLDFGCAMGFFSIPLAELVGPTGRVVCVDCQAYMLQHLERRARRARVWERIEARLAPPGEHGLDGLADVDFALAFAVVHEVEGPERLLAAVHAALRPGGQLLLAEPTGHVRDEDFAQITHLVEAAGLTVIEWPRIRRSNALLARRER